MRRVRPRPNGHRTPERPARKRVCRARLEEQFADSLWKYWHLTEFVQRDDQSRYVVYGTHTEQGKVGVVARADSVLLLYQAGSQDLQRTARIPFPDYAFRFKQV